MQGQIEPSLGRDVDRRHILIVTVCLLAAVILASLVLLGAFNVPLNPEVVETEVVRWNMTRPEGWGETTRVDLDDVVLNSYASDTALAKLKLEVLSVRRSAYSEYLLIRFNVTANVTEGFIHSLMVKFNVESLNSSVDIEEDPDSFRRSNVEISQIVDYEEESFVDAQALGKPESCMLRLQLYWTFFDRNTSDQTIVATLEATYFNGTAYEKAVVPIELTAFASPN